MELKQSFQIDPKESTVFLLYSRYWYFCKYSHRCTNTLKKESKKKKKFYERLIEEYILNQWQFCYFEWTIEKIKKLKPFVDSTSFLLRDDPPHDYLVHFSDCFNLYGW